MPRRAGRVVSTLLVAAGILFGTGLILPALLGWERYVIVSGSMTYECTWNTTGVTDGAYDLRATATDAAGRAATSTITGIQVDNTGPRASTITATNAGTSGTLSAGDRLSLGYTEAIAPSSLISGWAGVGRSVSVAFARLSANTTAVVTDTASGSTVPIGALSITGRWTGAAGATFGGTLTLSGATLTLDLGAQTGGAVAAATPITTLSWTNTTATTDVAGNSGVATAVTGTGTL